MAKDPAFLFKPSEWNTPNTYDTNFMQVPSSSGVYLLVHMDISGLKPVYEILYVGSAKDLKQRYSKHEVLRALRVTYFYIQFYFKIKSNYRQLEKELIGIIQPKYNTQWR